MTEKTYTMWWPCQNPTYSNDPSVSLHLFPHYSEERFQHARTVFGTPEKGLNYDYSDRLEQWWGRDKMKQAREHAMKLNTVRNSADYLSVVVSFLYDEPRKVLHVLSGINSANGYPYFVVGHKAADSTGGDT